MTECTQGLLNFPSFDRRKIEGSFGGGEVSSDGGLMLLRQVDRKVGLTQRLAAKLPDRRGPGKVRHELRTCWASASLESPAVMRISTMPRRCVMTRYSRVPWKGEKDQGPPDQPLK
jgi:hypothetical protein